MSYTDRLTALENKVKTLASKLVSITENQSKVYDKGHELGYSKGMVDGANNLLPENKILTTTKTGNSLCINDVSEINHKCTLTSNKDTEVKICGRNIFDISTSNVYHNNAAKYWCDMHITETGLLISPTGEGTNSWSVFGFCLGTISEFAGRTITVSANSATSITSVQAPWIQIACTDVTPTSVRENPTYKDGGYVSSRITLASSGTNSGVASASYTFTGKEERSYVAILFQFTYGGNYTSDDWTEWSNIQVELSDVSAEYEQYNGIVKKLHANQPTTIDSMCPTISIIPNNDAIIDFTYNRSWGIEQAWNNFWDSFQRGGSRNQYNGSFNSGWTPSTFRPKYDLTANQAYMMFYNFLYESKPTSLKQLLSDAGVTLTFPSCGNFGSLFQYAKVTEIGELDFSTATRKNCTAIFYDCKNLKTIDKIILPTGQTSFSNWFYGCEVLENILFEGEIAVAISFSQSPLLTTESVQSIIDHLKDLTGTTAQTLTFHATVGAALTDEQKATITAKNWTLVY